MNKKTVIALILIIIVIIGGIGYFTLKDSDIKSTSGIIKNNTNTNKDNNTISGNTVLVVYYSAQSHTENVAKKIADNLKADIFEITPVDVYTDDDLNYNNSNSRVVKEYNDESLRNIELTTTEVENWNNYDIVLIGYPIWWGIAAWPTNTFVASNDFTGKIVVSFCTSASSELGQSGELLESIAGTGDWREGMRFSSTPTDNEIKTWTDSLIS